VETGVNCRVKGPGVNVSVAILAGFGEGVDSMTSAVAVASVRVDEPGGRGVAVLPACEDGWVAHPVIKNKVINRQR
jgi:hypothetical protein